MPTVSRVLSAAAILALTAAVCPAQSVVSAHSGTLHYFEGDVSIDGAQVQAQKARFQEIKEQGVLRTRLGRAEILLTPGVFLRVGENSAIKVLDNRLVSTRVELLNGTAILESDDPQLSVKDSPVTLIYKDYSIQPTKHGVIEISADPAQVKVYKGEAFVNTSTDRATVKEGRLVPFSAALVAEKFDEKIGDDLLLWTRDRSQSLSAASMSSARSINSGGSGYLSTGLYGLGGGLWTSGWFYNPYLGMFTFVPAGGTFFNPWGFGFFSPTTVYNYYVPTNYWYGGGARGTGSAGNPVLITGTPGLNRAAPLSSIRGAGVGTNSMPALGSALRSGNAIGLPAASSPAFLDASQGGGNFGAAAASAGGGGGRTTFNSPGVSAAPAAAASHGGGGGPIAAPAAGHR